MELILPCGILAFDPGNKTGWAYLEKDRIRSCGLINVKQNDAVQLPMILADMEVWIEYPEHRRGNDRADPNDLMALDRKVGRIQERYLLHGIPVNLVHPSEWKGSVPKTIHHSRIKQELKPLEFDIIHSLISDVAPSDQHNVWDAVGLALWAAKKRKLR